MTALAQHLIMYTTNLITYQADLNLDGVVSMLDLAYLNSGAYEQTNDTDVNFDGMVDINDLALLDADWMNLHTGDQTFLDDGMTWSDLSHQSQDGSAYWNDESFQTQMQSKLVMTSSRFSS